MITDYNLVLNPEYVEQDTSRRYLCTKSTRDINTPPEWAGGFGQDRCGVFAVADLDNFQHRLYRVDPQGNRLGIGSGNRQGFPDELNQMLSKMEGFFISSLPCQPDLVMQVMGKRYNDWVAENPYLGEKIKDGVRSGVHCNAALLNAHQYVEFLDAFNALFMNTCANGRQIFYAPTKNEILVREKLIAPSVYNDFTVNACTRKKVIGSTDIGRKYLWINHSVDAIASCATLAKNPSSYLPRILEVVSSFQPNGGMNREGVLRGSDRERQVATHLPCGNVLLQIEDAIDAMYESYDSRTSQWFDEVKKVIDNIDRELEPARKAFAEKCKKEQKKMDKDGKFGLMGNKS